MKKFINIRLVVLFLLIYIHVQAGPGPLDPPEDMVTVHVYRPKSAIGLAWVFNLRVNGVNYEKVKNGKHLILKLKPGKTVFSIKKKTVEVKLEAGKTYYLRSSIGAGFIIGSINLLEVTESFAKQELAKQ